MYRKLPLDHPSYKRIKAIKAAGGWACDAITHNSPRGCSNPECFNQHKDPRVKALWDAWVASLLAEVAE